MERKQIKVAKSCDMVCSLDFNSKLLFFLNCINQYKKRLKKTWIWLTNTVRVNQVLQTAAIRIKIIYKEILQGKIAANHQALSSNKHYVRRENTKKASYSFNTSDIWALFKSIDLMSDTEARKEKGKKMKIAISQCNENIKSRDTNVLFPSQPHCSV